MEFIINSFERFDFLDLNLKYSWLEYYIAENQILIGYLSFNKLINLKLLLAKWNNFPFLYNRKVQSQEIHSRMIKSTPPVSTGFLSSIFYKYSLLLSNQRHNTLSPPFKRKNGSWKRSFSMTKFSNLKISFRLWKVSIPILIIASNCFRIHWESKS